MRPRTKRRGLGISPVPNEAREWRIPSTLEERQAAAHRKAAVRNPAKAEKHLQAAELLDPPRPSTCWPPARDWSDGAISGKVPPPTLAQIEQSTREHNEKSEWFEHN